MWLIRKYKNMTQKLKFGNMNLLFVFRHKWDFKNKIRHYELKNQYRLGLWVKKDKIISRKNIKTPKKWASGLINDYTIGVDLILCWISLSFNFGGHN